ncbi:MAG TPA: hydrogenase [Methanospirillum sp.]|nr:hydrogenase [Methanospirillum sp.]
MIDAFTLHTSAGAWNPIFYLVALAITLIIGWLIWSLGRSDYDTGKNSTAPFLSGNEEPAKEDVHVRASNLYWGYTDALAGYYSFIKPFHTGNAADYLLSYLAVTALLIIVVVIFR